MRRMIQSRRHPGSWNAGSSNNLGPVKRESCHENCSPAAHIRFYYMVQNTARNIRIHPLYSTGSVTESQERKYKEVHVSILNRKNSGWTLKDE